MKLRDDPKRKVLQKSNTAALGLHENTAIPPEYLRTDGYLEEIPLEYAVQGPTQKFVATADNYESGSRDDRDDYAVDAAAMQYYPVTNGQSMMRSPSDMGGHLKPTASLALPRNHLKS